MFFSRNESLRRRLVGSPAHALGPAQAVYCRRRAAGLHHFSRQAAFLLSFFALSIILFSVPSGFLGGRFGRKRAIQVGIIAFAILLTCGYFVHSVLETRILLSLAGVAWSLILVNSLPMVIDSAPPERLGAYTGLYYLASQSSAIAGPILAGKTIAVFGNDYRVAFLYGAVALGMAFAFMRGVRRGEALISSR